MCRRIAICLLLLTGSALNIQTVNAAISGKVTNKAGNPIEKAVVTLVELGVTDTTKADGTYSLTTTGVITSFKHKSGAVVLKKGILEFSLKDVSPVKIEIFDAQGTLLKKELVQSAQKGLYRFNLAENFNTTKLLLIRVSIGQEKVTFSYLPSINGKSASNSAERSALGSGKVAKIADVSDTLKISAKDYLDTAIAISIYDTTINVTLTSAVSDGVAVRLDQERQTIVGFGINIALMPGSLGSKVMNELYSTSGTDALGLSILRVGMTTKGDLSGTPSDISIARNAGAKIIGSCWSAEASWKDNGRVDRGGHLLPNYREQWATRIANFAKAQNLYAMSIANESDFASCKGKPVCTDDYETMVYTAKEMVEFVKVAGRIFRERAPGVKMIAPEASEWLHVWSTASATGSLIASHRQSSDPLGCGCFSNTGDETGCAQKCLDGNGYAYGRWLAKDTAAWNSFDILGVHQYDSQIAYPWPADVTGGKRTKEVWQTEMSGVMHWPEQGPTTHIENGVAVARWIQSALTIGEASVWCYWWYEAYYQNDNEGLALIQGNSGKAKRYYTMGNYSRYMRPGQTVVNITGTDKLPEKVFLTASKDDAGKVVIVAVNETTSPQSVPIKIAGGTAPASFKPIVTNKDVNWKEGSAVSVSDGVLTMELEKMSVTTFVSQ